MQSLEKQQKKQITNKKALPLAGDNFRFRLTGIAEY